MARGRRKSSRFRLLLLAAVVIVAGIAVWTNRKRIAGYFDTRSANTTAVVDAAADRVDPLNEGRRVRLNGKLEAGSPARDEQLGISTKAAVLLREVEMYQWRERCSGEDCSYEMVWSRQPVDSRRFRHVEGHENPPQRLLDARFASDSIRLGAFAVDADLVAAQAKAVELPVRAADLAPNLAATFSNANGMLYAGGDPAQPKLGEVRVSYRSVPPGNVELGGVQRGSVLAAQ
ncbi:MAG TPA: TMEM43 family protein [Rudaea sp.]|jgi:hypothetical protein